MKIELERTTIYKEHITLLPGVSVTKKLPALKIESTDFVFLADEDVPNARLNVQGSYSHSDIVITTECNLKLWTGEFDFKKVDKPLPYSVINSLELSANSSLKGFLCAVVKIPRKNKPYLM